MTHFGHSGRDSSAVLVSSHGLHSVRVDRRIVGSVRPESSASWRWSVSSSARLIALALFAAPPCRQV